MHNNQLRLYEHLIALTKSNEAFYYQDFNLDSKTYRIFNYRLASYSDFLLPGALQCRGTTFEVQDNQPICLAVLPMDKFFNLNENPLVIDLDLSKVQAIEDKADGSLMSTYIHNNVLRLKSKGSLFSEQALAAMDWLAENPLLLNPLHYWTTKGWTINLEWCSPVHRIVIGYSEPHLKVLNARNTIEFNQYMPHASLVGYFGEDNVIKRYPFTDPVQFINSIPSMQDVEGFVVWLPDMCVKVKTDWYKSLHHAKDSVNNPRRLFEAILDEGIDDLRSLFYHDPVAMQLIDSMQLKVDHIYNSMVNNVERYYDANKHLDRKEYAIKGQQDESLKTGALSYFGLAMNKYVGKRVEYKEFLKSKWKELGLKDISLEEDENV